MKRKMVLVNEDDFLCSEAVVIDSIEVSPGPVYTEDDTIPGIDGAEPGFPNVGPMVVMLSGTITAAHPVTGEVADSEAAARQQFHDNKVTLGTLFSPGQFQRLKYATSRGWVFGDGRVRDGFSLKRLNPGARTFTIPFVVHGGYLRSAEVTRTGLLGAGSHTLAAFKRMSGPVDDLIVTFYGPVQDSIAVECGGKSIGYNGRIPAGEYVRVDTDPRKSNRLKGSTYTGATPRKLLADTSRYSLGRALFRLLPGTPATAMEPVVTVTCSNPGGKVQLEGRRNFYGEA